ncbi:MAG: polysaccharide biosynthesis protein, partial [Verrucomicrobiota bacterium]
MNQQQQLKKIKSCLAKHRLIIIFAVHAFLGALAYTSAFLLRFDSFAGWLDTQYYKFWLNTLPLAIGLKLVAIWYFRLYAGLWRYAGINDLIRLLKAVVGSSVALIITVLIFYGHGLPRSVFVIDFLLTLALFGGLRFTHRFYRESLRTRPGNNDTTHRVLILGAGDTGEMAVRTLSKDFGSDYCIVGFLDDDPTKHKLRIHDIPVLGPLSEAMDKINDLGVTDVVFAIPDPPKSILRTIVNSCSAANINFHIMPTFHDVVSGRLVREGIRNVEVEDLLGRDPIHLNHEAVENDLAGKTVLITGGGGSIGSELARQVAAYNPRQLVLLDVSENTLYGIDRELSSAYKDLNLHSLIGDIKHPDVIHTVFEEYRPDIVYHAAAFKHVPFMEQHPDEAVLNNVFGTLYLAEAAVAAGIEKFVMISTDKAVRPSSIMGATKRCAELIMSAFNSEKTKFLSVRFGNVLGSNGSVVPLFRQQIGRGGPVTVTHPEISRYFITISEAVELVLHAGNIGKGGEVFVLEMGQPVKIVDLAKSMIELSGLEVDKDIAIEFTGLRPGEKLHEELIAYEEEVTPTSVPKILAHCTNGKEKETKNTLYTKLATLKEAAYA